MAIEDGKYLETPGEAWEEVTAENARLLQELVEITRKYRALDGGWGDMEQACDNLQAQLAEARAENERLRNGLRYLSVKLGVSSNLTIGRLARLAWDIAEEGKEAPEHIIDKQQIQEEQEKWEAAQDETP